MPLRPPSLTADQSHPISLFCGGSRNSHRFIDWFDGVFVLDVDAGTLSRRLAGRAEDEFGGSPAERAFVLRLQATKADVPKGGIAIDATASLAIVVDQIV